MNGIVHRRDADALRLSLRASGPRGHNGALCCLRWFTRKLIYFLFFKAVKAFLPKRDSETVGWMSCNYPNVQMKPSLSRSLSLSLLFFSFSPLSAI